MAHLSDDTFARLAVQHGYLTAAQVADARELQRKAAEIGLPQSLDHICVVRKLLTEDVALELSAAAAAASGDARRIGPYVVVEKLGQGGMGAVYKAQHKRTGVFVALKILPPSMATPEMIARFKREAVVASRLNHPNIVRYVEFGHDDTHQAYFCALEYVEGETIARRIARLYTIDERDAADVGRQTGDALEHAYTNGLVHRDVKPENVMITPDGTTKLLDLGLARHTAETATHLTQEGYFVGSPLYASPEQAQGAQDVDIRADIYSLGATLYHMVTGAPPFDGDSSMAVLQKHIGDAAPWPADANPDLTDGMCRIVAKAMCKRADDRYQTPRDLVADLERILAGTHVEIADSAIAESSVRMPRGYAGRRPVSKGKGTTKATRIQAGSDGARPQGRTGRQPRVGGKPLQGISGAAKIMIAAGAGGGVIATALVLLLAGGGPERPRPASLPLPPRAVELVPAIAAVPGAPPPESRHAELDATAPRSPVDALREARSYEDAHPADLVGARERYAAVAREFEGSAEAGLARIDVVRIASRLEPLSGDERDDGDVVWRIDFADGIPRGCTGAEFTDSGLSPTMRGAAVVERSIVYEGFAAGAGPRASGDLIVNLRLKIERGGWYQIMVGVRGDDGSYANLFWRVRQNVIPGAWQTASIPLRDFVDGSQAMPDPGRITSVSILADPTRVPRVLLASMWITKGGAEGRGLEGRGMDLVGWWTLDASEGTVAHDSSGNENHGVVRGDPDWRPHGGERGGALHLDANDGTTDYVDLPPSATLRAVPGGDFTLSAWFSADSLPPATDASSNKARYAIVVRPGRHTGLMFDNSGVILSEYWFDGGHVVCHSSTRISPREFHHAALVVDRRQGIVRLYCDGRREHEQRIPAGAPALDYGAQPWRIGCAGPGFATYGWPMAGSIDDVRIHARALDDAEIFALAEGR